ncbi:MAG TPA: hypothetical protein VGN65_13185 [Casimicrobiaceae bacterium]|jgi:hypothetical protein
MKRTHRFIAVVAGFALSAFVSATEAADEPPTGGRVPTVTRLVKLFTEREAGLADAIRAGDAKHAQQLLANDFEMRTGAASGSPIPRADWLAEMIRSRNPGEAASGMAVHDLNGTAIVSFTQGGGPNAVFVVDVWRPVANDWLLAIRYAAPAGTATFPIPGAGVAAPLIPKKY